MPLVSFTFLFFLSTFVLAASPQELTKIVKKSGLAESSLSILVESQREAKTVFSLNDNVRRIPASLTKLITAAAVLKEFGPGHQFVTALKSSSAVRGPVLSGNLYLVGDGDPGFVSESMWNLVNDFKRTGLKEISGDLVVDDSKFDQVRFDPSRGKARVDRAYDSPIGAMTFNWSSVNIYVRPSNSTDKAQVVVDPESDYFFVVNNLKSVPGRKSDVNIDLQKIPEDRKVQGVEQVTVSGSYGKALDEKVFYRAVENPALWAGYNLKSFLARRGIQVKGEVRVGKAPMTARSLVELKSKPVSQIVSDMMKFSNNYVAEIMTKNLAALKSGTPASMEPGIESLKSYLRHLKVGEFQLINPSGLSRENQFTAAQFLTLLGSVRQEFSIYPELLASLPIGGVDGTLKSRMKGINGSGAVRAKTGMLTGVAGLAGYAGSKDDIYSFVFLFNGRGDDTQKARVLFDRLSEELVK